MVALSAASEESGYLQWSTIGRSGFTMLKCSQLENTKWKNVWEGKQRKVGTRKGRGG